MTKIFIRLILGFAVGYLVAWAIFSAGCDSAPPLGSYGPPVPVIRDLSGVDFPTACWIVPGQYPCYDLAQPDAADAGTP